MAWGWATWGPATWMLPGKPPTLGKSQMQSCLLRIWFERGGLGVSVLIFRLLLKGCEENLPLQLASWQLVVLEFISAKLSLDLS